MIVTYDCCFVTHFCTTKTYVVKMSCSQLLLIEFAVYAQDNSLVINDIAILSQYTYTYTYTTIGSRTLALLYSTLAAIACPPRLCNVGSRKGSVENKICDSLVTC